MSPTAETLLLIFLAICVIYTLINGTSDIIDIAAIIAKKLRQKSEQQPFFHSPGPWVAEKASPAKEYPDFCIISEGVIIADVYGHAIPHATLPSYVNARLMAAAPEMFRLLQDADAALKFHPDGDTRPEDYIAATAVLLRRVQYGN